MFDTDWDDPSVAELARRRNQHPVETIIDLCLENDNRVFVQPLVNEAPETVLGLLQHPRTLATFSGHSGAHVCHDPAADPSRRCALPAAASRPMTLSRCATRTPAQLWARLRRRARRRCGSLPAAPQVEAQPIRSPKDPHDDGRNPRQAAGGNRALDHSQSGLCLKDRSTRSAALTTSTCWQGRWRSATTARSFLRHHSARQGAPHLYVAHAVLGCISAITPFNHPLNMISHKIAPAIATNNRVVAKPTELTPLTALLLAESCTRQVCRLKCCRS